MVLLAATTVTTTTTTTIIITLNVNKAPGNNGANCRRSIKKMQKIKRERATKKRAANASKNAPSLRIGVDYIDWINYIFITHSQVALKAAASASALIKFTQL